MSDSKIVTYNYPAVQRLLNSALIEEIASLGTSEVKNYTYNDLKELHSSETEKPDIYNVINRLKLYNDVINTAISSYSEIVDEYVDVTNDNYISGNLYAATDHVMFNPGTFELTGNTSNSWIKARYVILSDFFLSTAVTMLSDTYEAHVSCVSVLNMQKLFGDCNLIEISGYVNTINYGSLAANETLIYASDIVSELHEFIDELQKIRIINTKIVFLQNYLSSATVAHMKTYADMLNDGSSMTKRCTSMYVTPYSQVYGANINNEKNSNTTANDVNKVDTLQIDFRYLAKLHSNIEFKTTSIPIDSSHSNGIYSYDNSIEIPKMDLHKICDDFVDVFSLKKNCVISKANVLKAIDYIFYQWLQNLQTATYSAVICHSNCHSNTVGIFKIPEGYIPEEEEEGTCCYCGKCCNACSKPK